MIKKEKKKEIVSELKDAIKSAESFVFVNFHGLSVDEVNEMRSRLRDSGIGYRVAKKTLLKRALSEFTFSGTLPSLEGEIGLAWGDDPTAPAREVYSFYKEHKEQVQLVGGVFEGEYLDKAGINEIAEIPDLQTLRGMFVNIINSPIQGLAIALNAIAEKKA